MRIRMWRENDLSTERKPDGWFISASIHVILICGLILLPGPSDTRLPYTREVVTPLVYVPPRPHTPLEAPPIRVRRELPKLAPPRIQSALAPPPVIPPVVAKRMTTPVPIEHPKAASIAAPEPVQQTPLAPAPLQTADLKSPSLPSRYTPPVKTGVFDNAGQSANGHTPSPHLEVQTGGFDSPRGSGGLAAKGASTGSVHLGGFGDSGSGSGSGHGSGGGQVVANAGFGNGAEKSAAPGPARHAESTPAETPVEVLWKPKPAYTSEARSKKLEGAVTLEVVFHATGQIQVLRVVHGLGSGLDESARTAAEQIRFRPGKKDGVPVDRTGLVQITFELS